MVERRIQTPSALQALLDPDKSFVEKHIKHSWSFVSGDEAVVLFGEGALAATRALTGLLGRVMGGALPRGGVLGSSKAPAVAAVMEGGRQNREFVRYKRLGTDHTKIVDADGGGRKMEVGACLGLLPGLLTYMSYQAEVAAMPFFLRSGGPPASAEANAEVLFKDRLVISAEWASTKHANSSE